MTFPTKKALAQFMRPLADAALANAQALVHGFKPSRPTSITDGVWTASFQLGRRRHPVCGVPTPWSVTELYYTVSHRDYGVLVKDHQGGMHATVAQAFYALRRRGV